MACAWDGKLITLCEVCLGQREVGDEDKGCGQSFGADGIKLRGEGVIFCRENGIMKGT